MLTSEAAKKQKYIDGTVQCDDEAKEEDGRDEVKRRHAWE